VKGERLKAERLKCSKAIKRWKKAGKIGGLEAKRLTMHGKNEESGCRGKEVPGFFCLQRLLWVPDLPAFLAGLPSLIASEPSNLLACTSL